MRNWFLIVVVCLAILFGLGYYKYTQIQAAIAFGASFPEPVESVEAFVALEEVWQPTTSVTAELVAVQSVDLSTELAGRIVEVGFAPGAKVRAGQVLVQLDISEQKAQLAAARADAEIARLDLMRNQRLIASGAAAEDARDRAKARFDASTAFVDRLLAVIDKHTLRAPFDAYAGLHVLERGQYLDKATFVVRLIGVSDQIWVDFTLPQQQALMVEGTEVQVLADEPEISVPASIIARDAFVNLQSRNVRFRAVADNTQSGFQPGSLVHVEVPVGKRRIATLVPDTAVRRDAFGASVYVLKPAEESARAAERASKRAVQLGAKRGSFVIISGGLSAGERIAAVGAFKLREGVLVRSVAGKLSESPSALIPDTGD